MGKDVFISFKNSVGDEMTEDRRIAESLFHSLSMRNIDAFYSNISLLEFGESEYKKSIDEALEKASVLIAVATSIDFLESPWLRYEWEGFHADILSGVKKDATILSYTKNILQTDLPRSLRLYQNFQINSDEANKVVDFICSFIEKHSSTASQIIEEKNHSDNDFVINQRNKSIYSPIFGNELNRLRIQAENSIQIDTTALNYVKSIEKEKKLTVLDVGSAYGFVAESRFSNDDQFSQVFCIDSNVDVINKAKQMGFNEKLSFTEIDVESAGMEHEIEELLKENGITSVDIIYSALTIHHLKDPLKALRRLRKFLSQGGYFILRGSDDGSKIAFPDNSNLMEKIIEKTLSANGVSDRFNGRKIYSQLFDSGYNDIKVFSLMRDTSNLSFEERSNLFEESFSYRINYFKKSLEKNPGDFDARDSYSWMQTALELFENEFHKKEFWYAEYDYVGVARKL